MGKFSEKLKAILSKVKEAFKKAIAWMSDNKELTIALVPVAASFVGGSVKIIRDINRKHDLHQQKMLRTHYVYDPSSGIYLRMRRSLTNHDAVKLAELKREGFTVTEALHSMGLLKESRA